jgi:hypothetical protein
MGHLGLVGLVGRGGGCNEAGLMGDGAKIAGIKIIAWQS